MYSVHTPEPYTLQNRTHSRAVHTPEPYPLQSRAELNGDCQMSSSKCECVQSRMMSVIFFKVHPFTIQYLYAKTV